MRKSALETHIIYRRNGKTEKQCKLWEAAETEEEVEAEGLQMVYQAEHRYIHRGVTIDDLHTRR